MKFLRWFRKFMEWDQEVLPPPCRTLDRDPYSKQASRNALLHRQR